MKTISQRYEAAPLAALRVHPRNAKRGAVDVIRRSIDSTGFYGAVVAQRSTGYVLAGNHRFLAATASGASEVPTIWVDVDDATATKILLVDNRSAELGENDGAALLELLRELDPSELPSTGYTADDLDALLRSVGPPPELEPQYEDDDAPPAPNEPTSQLGELYALGPHRLACGDARDPAVWDRLLGGEAAMMLWTDPPYGVAYEGKTKDKLTIANDDLDPEALRGLLLGALGLAIGHLAMGAAVYVAAPAGPLNEVFAAALRELDVWRQSLVWSKDSFALGRSDYHYRHEPVFYGWKPGAAHRWFGGRTEDTVHMHPKPARSKDHPTMKPTGLIRRHIQNSTRVGEVVVDAFGGSGSTLIAAALCERQARLVELSPRYCDVIRRRWTRWARGRGFEVGPGALEG